MAAQGTCDHLASAHCLQCCVQVPLIVVTEPTALHCWLAPSAAVELECKAAAGDAAEGQQKGRPASPGAAAMQPWGRPRQACLQGWHYDMVGDGSRNAAYDSAIRCAGSRRCWAAALILRSQDDVGCWGAHC